MAKWKLILNNKYVVSTSGRVQKKGDYSTTLGRPKRNDVPQFFNIAGQLSVTIEHRIVTMSVARLVAHAFVDGFDMFNTNHELQLIDTSKRPKLKNLAAHVPQDIPESANLKVYLIEDLKAGDIYEAWDGGWWKMEYVTRTRMINSTRVNDVNETAEHFISEVKTVCFLDCAQLNKTLA